MIKGTFTNMNFIYAGVFSIRKTIGNLKTVRRYFQINL